MSFVYSQRVRNSNGCCHSWHFLFSYLIMIRSLMVSYLIRAVLGLSIQIFGFEIIYVCASLQPPLLLNVPQPGHTFLLQSSPEGCVFCREIIHMTNPARLSLRFAVLHKQSLSLPCWRPPLSNLSPCCCYHSICF
jgi:hypothetical protein